MDFSNPWEWIFWLSFGFVAYTFVGYPVVIGVFSWTFSNPASKGKRQPPVSVVLVAFNEAGRIRERIENLLASDYPSDRLEIVVVTDGSTDETPDMVRAFENRNVKLIAQAERSGKAACLNEGVPAAGGEIIVFCDARQRFAPETIANLVANFGDPRFGAVSGELFIESSTSSVGGGVDIYWKLEKFIRESEARMSSVVGATGAVYAIRRELFRPIPPDTLLDDVVIPMQIAMAGYRVGFDPTAPAFDPQTTDPARERRRKLRTLAGNFQMLFRHPAWLMPWRTGIWWQVVSHKYTRIAAPVFMLAMFLANGLLVDKAWYGLIFQGQCGFYLLAILGALLPGIRLKLFSIPAGFVFLNLMTVGGFWNYLRGAYDQGKW
jgi:cellulose synthase/poly-beta-1,6-N-acetylglucosamine synthase-like glycosyltransferase